MSSEIAKILAAPETKEEMVSEGMKLLISTPEQLAAMIKADMAKFGKIVKAAKITAG